MENKYYSPKIEEFCVGFEFEHKDDNYDGREEFQKTIIESDGLLRYPNKPGEYNYYECEHLLSNIKYDLDHGDIRVKYLDKEDIESFGFKYYDKIEDSIYFKYKSFRLAFNPIVNKVEIVEFGPCHFRGSIKNKSELKVILKQIGIINE